MNVGTLLREIEELGLADRTMIVISSDHGEAFFEHGNEGHARTLYTEVQSVPFIIHLPFRLEPGVVVDSTVANVDVWPTVLDLLGLDPIDGADGRSLVPLIEAAARGDESQAGELADRSVYSQLNLFWGQGDRDPSNILALVKAPYRMVNYEQKGTWQLFDHTNDPQEQIDIAQDNAEIVEEFRASIERYMSTPNDQWETSSIEIDDMRLNQLRALGYAIPEHKNEKQRKQPESRR